jgi:chemotaxis receptor (MCP) glutamine deamidase CheD/CheY-like chemotaxis protein
VPAENIFLLPGEMAFSREPTRISTLLGSCVAVTLYDRHQHWGGLNHYMVPEVLGTLPEGKIGRTAIPALLRLASMAGSKTADLEARIIGGAAVLGAQVAGSASVLGDIGQRNGELAREMLSQAGIPVVQEVLGGNHGRRIHLDSASGQVEIITMGGTSAVERSRPPRHAGERYRVLIVDDSALVRQLLGKVIAGSDDFEVCGEAEDPFAARERILDLDPDILCLDLIMPKLDGLTFLRRLMHYKPIPTVVVSTIAKAGSAMRAKVLEAGAIDAIDKEDLRLHGNGEPAARILLPALRRAALTPVSARPQGST